MSELLTLCAELASQWDQDLGENPALTDCLKGLQSHRVLKNVNDESLKSVLKLTNQLLNEPKSRPRGLMLLDNILTQVDSSRFVTVQDTFVSTIQLLSKCLNLDLSHHVLALLLPCCSKVPEFSQAVVTSVVPKLLTRFGGISELPKPEEIRSVTLCLENFRGPCGAYRSQLEKVLRPYFDSSRKNEIVAAAKIFPLLSCVGGGGPKGEKYCQDWQNSVYGILKNIFDALTNLYQDSCSYFDTDNPYAQDGSRDTRWDLPGVKHADVLIRTSRICQRLSNLTRLLITYLEEPFPSAKPVPIRGILNIVTNMLLVNPVSLLKNERTSIPKETVHLAALVPFVIKDALHLLNACIQCCGSLIFTEVAGIELQIVEQLKWMAEKPGAFEDIKCEAYTTLQLLLTTTHGCVTSSKNSATFLQQIFLDIRILKQAVSLTKLPKGKKGKSQVNGLTSIQNTEGPEVIEGSERCCAGALKTLELLLPALDYKEVMKTYILLVTTVWEFAKTDVSPSPYKSSENRCNAFHCLAQLVMHPHSKAPVSTGLIIKLLQLGSTDYDRAVVSLCGNLISRIERVVHPSSTTLDFPPVKLSCSSDEILSITNGHGEDIDEALSDHEESVNLLPSTLFHKSSFCQTEDTSMDTSLNALLDVSAIKEAVAQSFRENLEDIGSMIQLRTQQRALTTGKYSSQDEVYEPPMADADSENGIDMAYASDEAPEPEIKRPKLPIKRQGHMVLAKEVNKNLLDDVEEETNKIINGFSTSRDVDDDIGVRVEDMLLSFDEELNVPT